MLPEYSGQPHHVARLGREVYVTRRSREHGAHQVSPACERGQEREPDHMMDRRSAAAGDTSFVPEPWRTRLHRHSRHPAGELGDGRWQGPGY